MEKEKIFIKMDIEGAEYFVVPTLREVFAKYDITLYLSLHPGYLMMSLIDEASGGLLGKIGRRRAFGRKHRTLLDALPFKYIYDAHGNEMDVPRRLRDAVMKGDFPTELVATNEPWRA